MNCLPTQIVRTLSTALTKPALQKILQPITFHAWSKQSTFLGLPTPHKSHLAHRLGCPSAGGNNVAVHGTPTPPVLLAGAVHGLLGGSGGVHCGHEAACDAKLVVDYLQAFKQHNKAVRSPLDVNGGVHCVYEAACSAKC